MNELFKIYILMKCEFRIEMYNLEDRRGIKVTHLPTGICYMENIKEALYNNRIEVFRMIANDIKFYEYLKKFAKTKIGKIIHRKNHIADEQVLGRKVETEQLDYMDAGGYVLFQEKNPIEEELCSVQTL